MASQCPDNSTDIHCSLPVCNLNTCSLQDSFWEYRPSLALNGTLLALFGVSLILNIGQAWLWKTWTFLTAMFFGNLAEILGYAGRILAYHDPFSMNNFLIQICCLTIAPAFFCAGIYLSLSRIVTIFGADISRIPPIWYTRIFIGCDIVSLVLQGAGGGIASVRSQNNEDPKLGNNVMMSGLSFQVFTLVLFMALCAEYAWRVKTTERQLAEEHEHLRGTRRFKGFLVALAVATLLILGRSIFRVVEMSQGWDGEIQRQQNLFFICEGVFVIVAVLLMNVWHPGYCLGQSYHVARSTKGSESSDGEETVSTSREVRFWEEGNRIRRDVGST